ncbi:MAG: hypothetical protein ABSC71_22095, partial [Candidatus Acidiferrales bacterium]
RHNLRARLSRGRNRRTQNDQCEERDHSSLIIPEDAKGIAGLHEFDRLRKNRVMSLAAGMGTQSLSGC